MDKEDDARKARKEEDGVAARLARLEAKVEEESGPLPSADDVDTTDKFAPPKRTTR